MKRINAENWKIKVLKSDRNEVRFHVISGTLTVLYKNQHGLDLAYAWANKNSKAVCLAVAAEYRRLRLQGA